jgi:hypothetical protein
MLIGITMRRKTRNSEQAVDDRSSRGWAALAEVDSEHPDREGQVRRRVDRDQDLVGVELAQMHRDQVGGHHDRDRRHMRKTMMP